MSYNSELSIVIARVGPSRHFDESVNGFLHELDGRGRILVMDAEEDAWSHESKAVRVISCPRGSLAPELWRDGLNQSSSHLVAFTTAQMIPRAGWLTAMRDALHHTDAAGVGGPIAPGDSLSNLDRALYLLRYANYLPPVPETDAFDPPGDNAIYRRDRLVGLEVSWKTGFWEVDVHRHLRARGQTLACAQNAIIDFHGGGAFASSLAHRLIHAQNYGAGRFSNQSVISRLARSAIAPAVPPLLLSRILGNLKKRNEPIGPWLPALPHLGLLLAVWSAGEATGALFGPPTRPSRAA